MLKFIVSLAAAVLIMIPNARALDWKSVSQQKSKLVVYGIPFHLTYSKSQQAHSGDYSKSYDYQAWKGNGKQLELSANKLINLGGSWADFGSWDAHANGWKYLKNKNLQWGSESSTLNKMGTSRFRHFAFGQSHCFFVLQMFGAAQESGRPNIILSGYYCQNSPIETDLPALIIASIGYREEGVPDAPIGTIEKASTRTTPPKITSSLRKHELQIALNWEGYQDLMLGKMYIEQDGGKGTFKIPLPDGSGKCQGTWQWTSGKYDTNDLPKGTWAVACDNGLAASGVYKSTEAIKGTGIGTDAKGRKVRITYKQ